MVAGPTTLWALLTSLRLGFRTLAIEKRSSEVWTLLGSVKTDFARFGSVLDAVQKKLARPRTRSTRRARAAGASCAACRRCRKPPRSTRMLRIPAAARRPCSISARSPSRTRSHRRSLGRRAGVVMSLTGRARRGVHRRRRASMPRSPADTSRLLAHYLLLLDERSIASRGTGRRSGDRSGAARRRGGVASTTRPPQHLGSRRTRAYWKYTVTRRLEGDRGDRSR